LNAAAFDPALPAFERLIPALVSGYDELANSNPLKPKLADPDRRLRGWDYRWSLHSVATTLAVLWGDALWEEAKADPDAEDISVYDWIAEHMSAQRKLAGLAQFAIGCSTTSAAGAFPGATSIATSG
jgi:acyl-homoserine-lactone acylase